MKISKAAFAFGILGSITAGCISEFEKFDSFKHPSWEPRFAVPVVDASLTLGDIVAQAVASDHLTTDANGKYIFTYSSDFTTRIPENAIPLQPQSVQGSYKSPITGYVPTGSEYTESYLMDFQVDGNRELTSIKLKDGLMGIMLASTFRSDIGVTIEFPSIVKDGKALTTNEIRLNQSTAQQELVLNQFDVLLNQDAAKPYNRLPYKVKVKFYGNNTYVTQGDELRFELQLNNLKFSAIEGFLGNIEFGTNPSDTIHLDLFKNQVEDGQVVFADPQISLQVTNSFGVPVKGSIINPSAILQDGTKLTLKGEGIDSLNNTTIKPATKQQKTVVTSYMPLTKENTDNIVKVFEPTPKKFVYDFRVNANEGTSQQLGRNQFVHDTSSISLRSTIKLPMEGRVVHYAMSDTMTLTLPENSQESVKQLLIRMIVSNGFPVDMDIKAIILDENDQKVDSIVPEDNRDARLIAAAADLDANGRVNQQKPTISTRDFVITKERYNRMYTQGRKMVIYARLNTTRAATGQNVGLYNDYKLRVQLGAQVKMSIGFN